MEVDRSPASRRLAAPAVAGAVLGLLVVAWTFLMGVTGWYRTPSSLSLFWVVIALQAIVIVATLWRTRPGRSYGQQVGTGLIASAVASVFVFVGSFVFTTVAFPTYFRDVREVRESVLREQGLPEAEIEETLERVGASQTPTGQAFASYMAILGTGFVVSVVAAAFLSERKRDPVPDDAAPRRAVG